MEKTLAIIKPDAVARGIVGRILAVIEYAGFSLVDMRMTTLTRKSAEIFYQEHSGKPFFDGLVTFMSSGPSVFVVLEKKNAIGVWRERMGPTAVEDAGWNTIRGRFGLRGRPIRENVVHGSDSPEAAKRELEFFYREVLPYV